MDDLIRRMVAVRSIIEADAGFDLTSAVIKALFPGCSFGTVGEHGEVERANVNVVVDGQRFDIKWVADSTNFVITDFGRALKSTSYRDDIVTVEVDLPDVLTDGGATLRSLDESDITFRLRAVSGPGGGNPCAHLTGRREDVRMWMRTVYMVDMSDEDLEDQIVM